MTLTSLNLDVLRTAMKTGSNVRDISEMTVKELFNFVHASTEEMVEELIRSYSGIVEHVIIKGKAYIFLEEGRYVTDLLSGMEPVEKAIRKINPYLKVHIEYR